MSALTRLEAIKDLIQEAVDKGATSVEQIHQTIAALPFEVLAKRGLLEDKVGALKDTQAQTIGSIYDAIRRVNREVGEMASGIIESLEDHATVQSNLKPEAKEASDQSA